MNIEIIAHILPIAIDQLKREYQKSPFKTVSTVILFASIFSFAAFFGIKQDLEKQRKIQMIEEKSPDIEFQIKELNEISDSIDNLSMFINKQKLIIQQQKEESIKQELALKDLINRKQEIEPVVQKYESVIKQWIALEKRENRWSWWANMALSFFLGVFASVVANFISKAVDNYRNKQSIDNNA
ncbi:MAG: hypothetical protein SD837_13640 [Candidatus Electrothrix scaldis]|nr:MAG: hypothetical protein SD837_13640 [Candidatus Electrothrix sp. GW3-3]